MSFLPRTEDQGFLCTITRHILCLTRAESFQGSSQLGDGSLHILKVQCRDGPSRMFLSFGDCLVIRDNGGGEYSRLRG